MADFGLLKCTKHEDLIGKLPDEILCCILSFVTIKEAGRTSVLSKRWKHVWKYVPVLDFDTVTSLCKSATREPYMVSIKKERDKFVNLVNRVLESHQTLELKNFRIYIDLDDSFRSDINKWLQYAFDKRVERMEVNLLEHCLGFRCFAFYYVFPPPSIAHRSWNSLKVLILKRLHVSGAEIESFLHNCKYLESLVVHGSGSLNTLEVRGPSLALQHLEIDCCFLKSLIVCDADNLISLNFGGPIGLVLESVPRLVHIRINNVDYGIEDVFHGLSCCFSKLEVLSLTLCVQKAREYEGKLPELSALKQLHVELYLYPDECMFGLLSGLTSFFRALQNLEKFVAKFIYPRTKLMFGSSKCEDVINYCVQHLEVVEVSAYRGRYAEWKLLKYLIENAVSLKKIIVDPRYQSLCKGYNDLEICSLEAEIADDARRHAEQELQGVLPSHITLQIL